MAIAAAPSLAEAQEIMTRLLPGLPQATRTRFLCELAEVFSNEYERRGYDAPQWVRELLNINRVDDSYNELGGSQFSVDLVRSLTLKLQSTYSFREMSALTGLSVTTLSNFFNQRTQPRARTLRIISDLWKRENDARTARMGAAGLTTGA